jgi:hypothetical protein
MVRTVCSKEFDSLYQCVLGNVKRPGPQKFLNSNHSTYDFNACQPYLPGPLWF